MLNSQILEDILLFKIFVNSISRLWQAFTFFATHFLELCELSSVHHNVEK